MPGTPAPTASAAFFDLDKTIIAGTSALAFNGPFRRHGLIDRRTAARGACTQLLVLLAGADAELMETLRRRISALCAGWDVALVRSIVEQNLHTIIEPMVYAEAAALLAGHRGRGDEIVVLSASGAEVVEPIARLVGADHCLATRMDVADGRYTGDITYYCYGAEKAEAARRIAVERGHRLADCHAYTDSITDLPLLEAVRHPTAVNPDRQLRQVARERGWPIRTFAAPRPLRTRLRGSDGAAAVAAGLGAVALAGAGWYGQRLRTRA